jgi:serine/threonine protein kinase
VTEALPRLFGAYQLIRKLAAGGLGTVFVARPLRSGLPSPIALKCLHERFDENGEAVQRFKHEAEIAVSIDSPHVVRIFDVGSVAGHLYAAMEYIRGWPVARVVRGFRESGRLPPLGWVINRVRGGLLGLHAIHAAIDRTTLIPLGTVHRDLSPSNIMIDRDGRMCLIDLGLVRSNIRSWQTRAGDVLGTPGYMSPEQARGEHVDLRSDIYVFACVLFELLVLERYLVGEDRVSLLEEAVRPTFRRPSELRPDVPPGFDRILKKALSVRPEARFGSAIELAEALEEVERSRAGIGQHSMTMPDVLERELRVLEREIEVLMAADPLDETSVEPSTLIYAERSAITVRDDTETDGERVQSLGPSISLGWSSGLSRMKTFPQRSEPLSPGAVPAKLPRIFFVQDGRSEAKGDRTRATVAAGSLVALVCGAFLALALVMVRSPDVLLSPVLLVPEDSSPRLEAAPQPLPLVTPRLDRGDPPRDRGGEVGERRSFEGARPGKLKGSGRARGGATDSSRVGSGGEASWSAEEVGPSAADLLEVASVLRRRAPPDRGREIDELIADILIWSRSTDRALAAPALRKLAQRLDAIGREREAQEQRGE